MRTVSKWRKVPDNVVLPSRWTCSENSCDPESFQEMEGASKQEMDLVEALTGLMHLLISAILEEGETLPEYHRPRQSIYAIDLGVHALSASSPQVEKVLHKQSCDCNVSVKSVKRRFQTLMLKREKPYLAGQLLDADDIRESIDDAGHFSPQHGELNNEDSVDDTNYLNEKKSSASPFKGSDSGSMMRILQDAAEQYARHCGNASLADHNRPLPIGTAASLAPNDQ
ncbi:hypothetical protein HAX54_012801 [Datura stramonium]|uniref:Uncharacterized protein n=1 Tax=Datura stramonium TaxID=4076 RepID=A0ABS8TM63_DATST|nr:hypothetical protein [Datura stramonium]